jgi:NAD(P)-dependent dehydrogenase (short-subunit alcohol dehydrogenase family)
MNKLDGKIAVVTGASRGMGLAIAQLYAREGARVVLSARSQGVLLEAVSSLRGEGLEAEAFVCDVSDSKQVEALARFAIQKYGHFDIWVNNAGIGGPYGATLDLAPDDFLSVLYTNMFGTYFGSTVAMRHFLPREGGKLINILGAGDRAPAPNQNAYGSSKSWIRVFTLALAKEYKDSGVGIFALQPGLMDTVLLTELVTYAGYEKRLQGFMPFLIRAAANRPEVPARKALWLASAATDGRTGLYVRVGSTLGVLAGFAREGVRHLLHLPAREVEIHTKILPSAFEPLEGESKK